MSIVYRALDAVGLRVIDKHLYSVGHFERERRRIFGRLDPDAYRAAFAPLSGELLERMKINEVFFLERAHWFGLQRPPRRRILDIGTGSGMFPFICAAYGHDAVGTDLPAVTTHDLWRPFHKAFGVRVLPIAVRTREPLPDLGGPYDLITSFRTRFHSTKPVETGLDHETHWSVEDWDFFLRDLVRHCAPDGRIFFMLNRLQEYAKGGGVPAEHRAYFRSIGGELRDERCLWINSLDRLRDGGGRRA